MDVIFERVGANPFTMNVDFFDTVPEIKENIYKSQGFPVADQTLIFQGTVLTDDFNILYSDIEHNSRIRLVLASDAYQPAKKIKSDVSYKSSTKDWPSPSAAGVKIPLEEFPPPPVIIREVPPLPPKPLKVVVVINGGRERIPVEVNMDDQVKKLQTKLKEAKVELPKKYFFLHDRRGMINEQTFRWHRVAQGDDIFLFHGDIVLPRT